jgi:hypothetical protein
MEMATTVNPIMEEEARSKYELKSIKFFSTMLRNFLGFC